jgi:transcription elongation factor Elf1
MLKMTPDIIFKLVFFLILFTVFIIAFYKAIKNYKKFTCPKCGHKQNKSKEVNIDKYKYIDHGRKTISGGLDKRFNTTFTTNKVIHYQVECEKCGHSYEYTYDKMQEIIDNDPVIKQLDQELTDISKSYIPRLREMKKEDPRLFKKMQKMGIIDKDFK